MEVDLLAKNKSDTTIPSKVNNQDSELEVNNQDSEVKKDSSKTIFSKLKNYFSSNKVISSLVVILLTIVILTFLTFSLFIISAPRIDKIKIMTVPRKPEPTVRLSKISIVSSSGPIDQSEFESEHPPSEHSLSLYLLGGKIRSEKRVISTLSESNY